MTSKPVPVTILTGFLGSGKTTLLARLLKTWMFGRAAVIINEFGEVGLDHDLVESGNENILELSNGCLCCRAQSDLSKTLANLLAKRNAGEIDFERIVIETSGLVDPVPVLQMIATDRAINERCAVDRVITTVDAVNISRTVDQYGEARSQIAFADLLLLTKTDLVAASDVDAVKRRLAGLNEFATVTIAADWDGSWAGHQSTASEKSKLTAFETEAGHDHRFTSISILRDRPLSATAVLLFLEGLVAHEGDKLLRVKGLVQLAEDPERPMVLHCVQQMIHQPVWLDTWPSDDKRTRIVLIGHGLSERWPSLLLDALEDEIAELMRERQSSERVLPTPRAGAA